MRRILVGGLLFALLVAAAWPPARVSAQQNEAAQQHNAAEFQRLWERLEKSRDPEERIALAGQALKLERDLSQWPLKLARDEARARLWWFSGLGHAGLVGGDRAENLEQAIAAYEQALQVLTRERSARDWASLQGNLGNAFGRRIRGDPADNLEKAVAAYEAALTVFTRVALPREWAETQHNLALAYFFSRIGSDRADNLEKAIATYEAALTVRTRDAFPREWAITQDGLGSAYFSRIRGDRADNLEKAIAAYEAALTVFTRVALPREWAETQNNLGNAYERRIRGDRADNREKAIAAYEAALTVLTREANPRAWALILSNLGIAYRNRIRGDQGDNREKAIAHLETALLVRTREALPREWAETQLVLANAYGQRIRGVRADNLEKAIAANEAALTVFTRAALPREWAMTQSNLGTAYGRRMRGDRADNLENAIAAYEAALTVSTREASPRDHLNTGRLLGTALVGTRKWREAGLAFAGARETFLLLFGQGLNDDDARDLITQAGPLFSEAAFVAAQLGDATKALELASEGKARLLAVSLRLQGLNLRPDKQTRLETLRKSIREQSLTYDAASGLERARALEKLATLRGELLALVKEADNSEAKSAGTALENAVSLVPEGGAIVVPIVTSVGGKILILSKAARGSPLTIVDLPGLTSGRLDKLMRGDGQVGASGGWLGAFKSESVGEWRSAIEGSGPGLWHMLAGRLDAALQERGVKPGARIVWLPTSALGLLPIGLAQDPASATRLGEKYELVTAPSLEALAQAARQLEPAPQPSLIAVVNPTGDLPFTEVEATLVAFHFADRPRSTLDKTSATPKAVLAGLKDKTYWHFASHGFFDWGDARKSGLKMRDDVPLSIGALLDAEGSLGRPRLVVLSACETGLYDVALNPDEFVGLPATFMQLGAAGVLATLWQVDDLATSLLLAKFYDVHLGNGLAPPTALRGAQAWLRTASKEELRVYARAAAEAAKLDPSKLAELESELATRRRTGSSRMAAIVRSLQVPDAGTPAGQPAPPDDTKGQPPFAHPYFWGGFVYTGL